MSIVRYKRKVNFSQFPNELVTDTTISAKAYRVMTYLMSLPDGWEVNNTDVCKKVGISKEMISKYWKELITRGWINRYSRNRINGKYANYEYHLNEVPFIVTTSDLQDIENTSELKCHYGETTPLTNTHSSNNTNSNNNTHIIKEKINKKETNVQEVIDYFNKTCKANIQGDEQTIKNITTILKEFSVDDIKLVIHYISNDEWYIERGMVLLPVICRSTKFATKLAIAKSHKNNPIKKQAKFNDVGEFTLEGSGIKDYATYLQEERDAE